MREVRKVKKWILRGDYIYSKDGDRHFISARRLCHLYALDQKECVFADAPNKELRAMRLPDLPILKPRYHGDYAEAIKKARGEK